jgi:hypothetical protein
MKIYQSQVRDHEGHCTPTWLNRNQVCNRLDRGVSGFFKRVRRGKWFGFWHKYGEEFHGMIGRDDAVYTTEGRYDLG